MTNAIKKVESGKRKAGKNPLAVVKTSSTTNAVANAYAAFGTGKSDAVMVRKSNLWRDNYNPLRGLAMNRLVSIMEAAERGAYAEVQLLLRKAEKRYPVLKGFIERLLSSVEQLGWDVKVLKTLPPGATPAMAEKQRAFLKQRYDLIGNLNEAIGQITLAEVRGYAILQKHRYEGGVNDGAVKELCWLEPWCWARDGYYGDFYYNEISRFGVGLGSCQATFGEDNRLGSEALPRAEFVMREVESPLYEIGLIAFVNWLMGRKDWAAFVEIFGLAKGVVIMPPNIQAGKEQEYQDAAEKVSDGVSGALPANSDIKFPTAGIRGEHPFEKFCEAQNQDVVMAATSGLLSMLTAGPGSTGGLNRGPNEEHQDVWVQISRMKAKRVNETLNRDFDVPELQAEFPGEPVCVYFMIPTEAGEDVTNLATNVLTFKNAGFEADEQEISDRAGMKLTKAATPAPTKPGESFIPGAPPKANDALRNRLKKMLNRAGVDPVNVSPAQAAQLYTAVAADLKPLRTRLSIIEKISDPEIRREKLIVWQHDIDRLKPDIAADSQTQKALEKIIAENLKTGITKKPEAAKP